MKFEYTYLLFLIPIVLVLILVLSLYDKRKRRLLRQKLISSSMQKKLFLKSARWRTVLRSTLWTISIVFLIVALAKPKFGERLENIKHQGISLLFAIDVSKSMLAEDVRPNRLELAKLSVLELAENLRGNNLGLVAFAGSAFLQCPLTQDYGAFELSLNSLDAGVIGQGGTDIAAAIEVAQEAFESDNSYKRIILITDGEDLEERGIEKANSAAKEGMIIYTAGVGSKEGGRIPIKRPDGRIEFLKDKDGKFVKSKLDVSTLKKIANAAKGFYVPLGNAGDGLEKIYKTTLSHLPKKTFEQTEKKLIDRFWIPLFIAFITLCLEYVIRRRRV